MNKPVIFALFLMRKMLFRCVTYRSCLRPKRKALVRDLMSCALFNLTAHKRYKD